jgi:processive 1,2-diacylglycerol beta-glucosyltransferase
MRALILTCNTGEGHNSSAAAIKEAFDLRGIDCGIVDSLSFVSEKLPEFIRKCHVHIYRHIPRAFRNGYSYSEKHESVFSDQNLIYKCLASGADRLHEMVVRGRYSLLICVHVFSALMVTELRRRYRTDIETCYVATDYTCTPSTGNSELDHYFIAHEELIDEYAENGIPRSKLIPAGIPVRQEFYEQVRKEEARKQLGVPADRQSVLLMCGSMGCGPVEEMTRELAVRLPHKCDLTVICGTNEKLRKSLSKAAPEKVRVLGYSYQMPLLMSAADLLVTKPGGISISEAAAKRLPMLFLDVVGGCEYRNLQFFTARRWAETYDTPEDLAKRCTELIKAPSLLQMKSEVLKEDFRGKAAKLICDVATAEAWGQIQGRWSDYSGCLQEGEKIRQERCGQRST